MDEMLVATVAQTFTWNLSPKTS